MLEGIPPGAAGASDFEEIVGEALKLCFFRSLVNIEMRVRNHDGRIIRDWVAANRATSGFWEYVRTRYDAVQVIWECKNYEELHADDFHQVAYYMNDVGGRFVVLVFRGEMKASYYQHMQRIVTNTRGFILPLNVKDLLVFLRQAGNGKIKEDHIQDRYDNVIRKLS
ncbi:hypothetical protein [Nocardia grenadensis]|uniref:hypothetical protein n=1 Tax=Nocardia grenadensis TaxID=931537 RepID=UPI003D8AA947